MVDVSVLSEVIAVGDAEMFLGPKVAQSSFAR